jgi:peroxiredoxin
MNLESRINRKSTSKLSNYRVLIAGICSPLAAVILYVLVYGTLTRFSTNREKDWLFRLSLSTLAMTVPFLFTLVLAIRERDRHALTVPAKVGLVLAIATLALALKPVSDGITRSKQSRNLALQGVPAPAFDTPDLLGKVQRLQDQKGKVVLLNIWATWCGPCRQEMPKLDRLYQERENRGFIVFGLSQEDADLQRKFLEQVPVSYPLLTVQGSVPQIYRDIARYPAMFLIDRQGRLQPAPGPDQPFVKVEAAVDDILNRSRQ